MLAVPAAYLVTDDAPPDAVPPAPDPDLPPRSAAAFGVNLRTIRDQRGLSQRALARQLGLAAHTHLSLIEAGKKAPSVELAAQIAAALQTTLDDLLQAVPAPPEDAERSPVR